jgi:hypothetical protein
MPQIVLSTNGKDWVGKELYPGEQYVSSHDVKFKVSKEDIVLEPTEQQLINSIDQLFKIQITSESPIFKKVVDLLTNQTYTNGMCMYFNNWKAKYGVSMYMGTDVKIK